MTLATFLESAITTGHDRVRVSSTARGHELHRGELATTSAEYLETLAREDASPLSRDAWHEYVVTVESNDGTKSSRHPLRVHGAAGAEEEHRVDPLTTGPGQVTGHLVRLIVDQHKYFVQLASKLLDKEMAETAELARLRRGLARRGEHEIAAKALEIEAAERAAERDRNKELWGRALAMGEPLITRLLPGGGGESALARVRATLTDPQLRELGDLLGPVRFGKLLSLDTPEKVATLLIDEVDADLGRLVFAVLTDAQRGLLSVACRAEMDRRTKAAASPPPAPANANGAPS